MKFKAYLLLLLFLCKASATLATQQSPPKVVALAPHLVELIFEIGAGRQIIGVSQYSDFPEDAKDIPVVGDYQSLNIEKIVALQPDLIIVWQTGHPVKDVEKLKALGFQVAYSDPRSISDVPQELIKLGRLLGKQSLAETKAAELTTALDNIQQQYAHKKPVKVFYELWPDPLSTIGASSWPSSILALCGAYNVFDDITNNPYPQVNIEQVLARKVDLIIQPLSDNQSAKSGFQWQNWPDIKAVKHNQIIQPDADKLHRMTSRAVEQVAELCGQIDNVRLFYQS
ncbi:cobalamin-binding protein [Planctobacterium marinum]|uniref:cobalamin-binding protein n=1 Tax=Planctobacterium marinum TaxID=1631968 RepID=UPI0030C76CA4